MRKIMYKIEASPTTYYPIVKLYVQHEGEETKLVAEEEITAMPPQKYSYEQQQQINHCNTMLQSKNLPELTEEETDFMLNPNNVNDRINSLNSAIEHTESLQHLAGFKVEKIISKV